MSTSGVYTASNYSKCWRGGRDSNPNDEPINTILGETLDHGASREAEKTGADAAPIADRNQNAANEALAVLVAALNAKGDVAVAARMLAAFEEPKPGPREPAEGTATVTE